MTGAGIELTVEDEGVAPAFRRLIAAGADLRPAMEEIAGDLEETTKDRFGSSTGPGGVAWTPSRRALKTGGKTLIASGQLVASLTSEATAAEARAGTNKEYGALHQFGGTVERAARTVTIYRRLRANMDSFASWRFVKKGRANYAEEHQVAAHKAVYPARPFLGVDAADERRVVGILAGFLKRVAGGALDGAA